MKKITATALLSMTCICNAQEITPWTDSMKIKWMNEMLKESDKQIKELKLQHKQDSIKLHKMRKV